MLDIVRLVGFTIETSFGLIQFIKQFIAVMKYGRSKSSDGGKSVEHKAT
jgi:hypothetical protein